jgi:nucleoside-diphosphate-sugar epimerase
MKVESERILLEAKNATLAPTILRLGTLFGLSPRMRFDLVVNLFVARAVFMRRIAILNGAQWRPLIHVGDAARAFITSLEAAADTVSGEVFNVGAAWLNFEIEQLGRAVARVVSGTEIEMLQNEDRRNYRVTFDKIHERLGFSCSKTMQYGIQEIYGAIRAGQITDFTTAQFNNQIALRALVRAGAKQSSPLQEMAAAVPTATPENRALRGDSVRSHAARL